MIDQQFGGSAVCVGTEGASQERRVSVDIEDVDARAVRDEHVRQAGAIFSGREVERSFAIQVFSVDVGTVLHKKFCYLQVAVHDGVEQGSAPLTVDNVDGPPGG